MVTRKRELIFMIGVFLISFFLEINRLETGSYKLDIHDILWTSRDILWTGVSIYYFHYIKKRYPYIGDIYLYTKKSSILSKKTAKSKKQNNTLTKTK